MSLHLFVNCIVVLIVLLMLVFLCQLKFISMYTIYGLLNGDEDEGDNHANDDDGLDLDMVTIQLLHLKSVSFKVFSGRPREISWVKLILKNAEVLETMTLFSLSSLFKCEKQRRI